LVGAVGMPSASESLPLRLLDDGIILIFDSYVQLHGSDSSKLERSRREKPSSFLPLQELSDRSLVKSRSVKDSRSLDLLGLTRRYSSSRTSVSTSPSTVSLLRDCRLLGSRADISELSQTRLRTLARSFQRTPSMSM